ncbi:MAG: type II/IV secretion system ATPase subunit [Thaumarchaeota archaeon]|nr:type II/IV secretion system ATPase subunit [Nitrososphaerota archaeon]
MEAALKKALFAFARRKEQQPLQGPLLIELLQPVEGDLLEGYSQGPFKHAVRRLEGVTYYEVVPDLSPAEFEVLKRTVARISAGLCPEDVTPLSFGKLIEVLAQSAAGEIAKIRDPTRLRELAALSAYEAVGMSTFLALATDRFVTEFYVDAPDTFVYVDHSRHGRCESRICLTERERKAIETHMDTFSGYTLDLSTPSLKNEMEIQGSRLRVSLDLAPLAVNSFSLDVRKLSVSTLSLSELIGMRVITNEAAAFLIASLEAGMNVTIVGQTGTGKTTLLNALDESLDPRLRRIYIEDAVETKDLLKRGYHQMKLKVEPFERGRESSRTKTSEIVKILHRSPDIVILGEIQSEEHSLAFFHALSSGVRGMQTFHASSPEQAIRRWAENHGISKTSLLDLDIIVQMSRPAKLGSRRVVNRVCLVVDEGGEPRLRDIYVRERGNELQRVIPWERARTKREWAGVEEKIAEIQSRYGDGGEKVMMG